MVRIMNYFCHQRACAMISLRVSEMFSNITVDLWSILLIREALLINLLKCFQKFKLNDSSPPDRLNILSMHQRV